MRVAYVFVAVGIAGCTSLLGDYQVGDNPGPGPAGDGGNSADATGDSISNVDGNTSETGGDGNPGDSSTTFLRCNRWLRAQPLEVAKVDPLTVPAGVLPTFDPGLWIYPVLNVAPARRARILVRAPLAPFRIYTAELLSNQVQFEASPTDGIVLDVNPTTKNIGAFVSARTAGTNNKFQGEMVEYEAPFGRTAPYAHFTLAPVGSFEGNRTRGVFAEGNPGQFFYAITSLAATTNAYTLIAGNGSATTTAPNPIPLQTFTQEPGLRQPMISLADRRVIFLDLDPNVGSSVFAFGNQSGGVDAPHPIREGNVPAFYLAGAMSKDNLVNMACAEVEMDPNHSPTSFTWRLGKVNPSDLPNLNVGNMPNLGGYQVRDAIPFDNLFARWYGEQFVAAARSSAGDGFNLIWYNAAGVLRAQEVGGDRLLNGQKVRSVTVVPSNAPNVPGSFYVAWTAATTEAGTSTETLFVNELLCE